jgi:mediator of RNA polymerase II transcription subunit 6
VESQTEDNTNKKREDASAEGGDNAPSASMKSVYPARVSAKKQENNLPISNAMRTTMAHSVLSFAQRTLDEGPLEMSQESSIASGTPAPAQEDTPAKSGVQTSAPQDSSSRSALASGKKKKKRWSP